MISMSWVSKGCKGGSLQGLFVFQRATGGLSSRQYPGISDWLGFKRGEGKEGKSGGKPA